MTNREWNSSSVMQEFEKVAKDSGWLTTDLNPEKKDFVGNPSKSPVGPFRSEKGEEYKDKTDETLKDMFDRAHKKSVVTVDSMGKGGLVENLFDQQEKGLEIAFKMPNGALVQVHANLIRSLVKIANELDENKKYKEAEMVDNVIRKMSRYRLSYLGAPILTRLMSNPYALGLMAVVGLGIGANTGFFSSMRENLPTDIKDLYDILLKASGGTIYSDTASTSAQKATQLLEPFVQSFNNVNFSSEENIKEYTDALMRFRPIIQQLGSLINKVELELGESRWFEFGMDRVTRLREKFNDVVKDYQFITSRLTEIGDEAKKQNLFQPEENTFIGANNVKDIQSILSQNDLLDSKSADGTLNDNTISAVKSLEVRLSNDLKQLGIDRDMNGKILSGGKIVMEPNVLREIIQIIYQNRK